MPEEEQRTWFVAPRSPIESTTLACRSIYGTLRALTHEQEKELLVRRPTTFTWSIGFPACVCLPGLSASLPGRRHNTYGGNQKAGRRRSFGRRRHDSRRKTASRSLDHIVPGRKKKQKKLRRSMMSNAVHYACKRLD